VSLPHDERASASARAELQSGAALSECSTINFSEV
jgi:hypothetical protein